ncbi:hypothetical protein LCGC14_2353900 [marine sediment metagenome]|uniref:Uncharacterized protein n=1 Tax=marine sediment metagenome TaxID=412755 RepID=A0A0F9F3B0_9ZZZZ
MPPVIIKNDPVVQKIRETLKDFKEQIMEYANIKLKIWEGKNQKGVEQMGEIISKTKIPREKGFLYYCGTDDEGNLTICRAEMARGKKKEGDEK